MKPYEILADDSIKKLELKVCGAIKAGYAPCGGVTVIKRDRKYIFVQAVVKR